MFKFLRNIGTMVVTIVEIRDDVRGLLKSVLDLSVSVRVLEERLKAYADRIEALEGFAENHLTRLEEVERDLMGFMSRITDRNGREK